MASHAIIFGVCCALLRTIFRMANSWPMVHFDRLCGERTYCPLQLECCGRGWAWTNLGSIKKRAELALAPFFKVASRVLGGRPCGVYVHQIYRLIRKLSTAKTNQASTFKTTRRGHP